MSHTRDKINRHIDNLHTHVLPVGETVTTSTTLGIAPADLDYIRRHLDLIERESYAAALRDIDAALTAEFGHASVAAFIDRFAARWMTDMDHDALRDEIDRARDEWREAYDALWQAIYHGTAENWHPLEIAYTRASAYHDGLIRAGIVATLGPVGDET